MKRLGQRRIGIWVVLLFMLYIGYRVYETQLDAAALQKETLEEAEDEIGVAGWIDPDTGEPAEEGVPRIEDH